MREVTTCMNMFGYSACVTFRYVDSDSASVLSLIVSNGQKIGVHNFRCHLQGSPPLFLKVLTVMHINDTIVCANDICSLVRGDTCLMLNRF